MAVLAAVLASLAVSFTTPPGRLVLTGQSYRLQLSAVNGRVLAVSTPKRAPILHGGFGCMWELNPNHHASMLGGCSFTPTGARRFSYRWQPSTSTLTLRYAAGAQGAVTVTIAAHPTYFDMRLALVNRGPTRDEIRFPAGLAGNTRDTDAGYLPDVMPGVKLAHSFFTHVSSTVQIYPSRWAFADWLAVDASGSHVALYGVNRGPIAPLELGFLHQNAPATCSGIAYCVIHQFETWVRTGTTWTSPVVRVRVGEGAQRAILDYRAENGIGAYPSLAEKLGASLGTLSRAPLIKADVPRLEPFAKLAADVARLPSPALVHPVAYEPGGHDAADPDFLPPDPRWGTNADFAAFVAQAHADGDLVMPYANLSWWDPSSPSAQAAKGQTIGALDSSGAVQTIAYGDHEGVIVSPYAPAVQQRVAREFAQFHDDVPADCLFLDQIGARPWLRDFNPAAPSPLAYDDGWIALLAPYRSRCLMAEDGWDRLARDFVGFHGSLLMMERQAGLPDTFFGAGNWQPFPLADWLFHDKVLMYEHDLYDNTMATDGEVLTWNMAFGLVSSFEWRLGNESDPWLTLAALLQRDLGPHYAGVPLASYTVLAGGVARSVFGDLTVVSNLSPDTVQGIAPDGFRASTADGSVVAGAYAGPPFTSGVHWLVFERSAGAVTVRQPVGADTPVTVQATGDAATALAADGSAIGVVPVSRTGANATFDYAATFGGKPVAAYRLASS